MYRGVMPSVCIGTVPEAPTSLGKGIGPRLRGPFDLRAGTGSHPSRLSVAPLDGILLPVTANITTPLLSPRRVGAVNVTFVPLRLTLIGPSDPLDGHAIPQISER